MTSAPRMVLGSGLILFAALVLQLSLMPDLRIVGAVGDLFLLVTVAAGIVGGSDRAAALGFAAGLVYDLVLDTPFGLSALTYALVGYGVGWASTMLRPTGWWSVAVAVVASVAAMALYTLVAHLVGSPHPVGELPRIAFAVSVWNAVLVLPARALLRRILGRAEPDRIYVALGR